MRMYRVMLRKATNFLRQPLSTQIGFMPVWVLLGIAKVVIFTFSFKRLAPRLGVNTGVSPWIPLLNPTQEARALQIGRLVRMTARYTPWNSNCFPQAVVARVLLGLYGVPYALYFGLCRDDNAGTTAAHAWIAAGRVAVTGGDSFRRFTVVGVFVAPWLASARQNRSMSKVMPC